MRKVILWILSLALIVSLIGNYFFFKHLQEDKREAERAYSAAVSRVYYNLDWFNETLESFMDEYAKTDRDEVKLMSSASWLQHLGFSLDDDLREVLTYQIDLYDNHFIKHLIFHWMANDILAALDNEEEQADLIYIKEKVDIIIDMLPDQYEDYLKLNANEEEALWEEIILTLQQME